MKDGVVQQIAPPIQLYTQPENKFVAGFIGSPPMNFLEVTLNRRNGSVFFELEGRGALRSDAAMGRKLEKSVGKKVILGIRPEDVHDKVYYTGGPAENKVIKGTVDVVEPMGAEKYLYLSLGSQSLVARVNPNNQAKENQVIDLVFNMEKVKIFDPETDKVLC